MKKQLLFIFFWCITFLFTPFMVSAQAPNLVLNGDFELGTGIGSNQSFTNWTEASPFDMTPDAPATANQFPINNNITCRFPGANANREIQSDAFTIEPGKTYRLTYTYRIRTSNSQSAAGTNITTSMFQAEVFPSNSATAISSNSGNSEVNTTVYFEFTIPADASYTQVYIKFTKFGSNPATAYGVAWLDDVKFQDASLLPITLSSFTGKPSFDGVNLTWVTKSEINNDKFTILRSSDGKTFEEIATIKGKGNSSTTNIYNFKDLNPFSGVNYYQIKQTDFDGKSEAFNPISVNFNLTSLSNSISVYAKNNNINLKLNWGSNETVNVSIFDLTGKRCYAKDHRIEKGNNGLTLNLEKPITPGIKILKVSGNAGSEVIKFNVY
ncbi:T9SS type A sorting domain-containing protein [Pedobacter sp. SD-b]|uniref:T9SS type A sorting domain-containing protein n=1 Tax=Pedobacter segetis TaxID=2793069 RepID=A0ABS1BJK6_9SPHI|nr:T9SS type A sorting domain-containing protein [Pedobacter segetis]MBK0383077.1 T9SS type A sorting domain-containing protein [Pedobacter segetis]